jgi:crotonobetaine/carnitine-CoA ligase
MTAGWAATADRVLPRLLRGRAGERPDAPFLRVEDGPAETFGQVLAAAERIAGQLAGLGVAPGDLVPLLAGTSVPSVHAWLGVNLAGAADVPLNTAYRGASLAHGVGLCRARLMIADPSFLPRVAEVAADLPALQTVVLLGGGAAPDLPGTAHLQ